MTKTKLIGGVVAATALLAPALVAAQDQAFEPLGIRTGAFLVYPSVSLTGTYDDNVFATSDDEEDDFITTLRPEVRAESQWSRHQLTATAFGEFGFFADENDSNYEDFGAGIGGRLDVTRESRTTGNLSFARLNEGRDSPDEGGVDEVTQYWQYNARLSHRHSFVRFFVQPTLTASRTSFESAGDLSNAQRDRNRYGGGLRVGFNVSPSINVFAEGNGDVVEYDDSGAVDRDSTGFNVRGGAEIDITRLIVGEFSIGYDRREYDDDALDDAQGLAATVGLTWTPTQLTTVLVNATSGVDETTVVFDGEQASGNLRSALALGVRHELRRNIILNGDVNYIRDDFEGTARTDDTFGVGAGVSYLINRNLSVNASYTFTTRDSDDDTAEYDRNLFRVGLTARL